jgi:hypothetical protein
MGRYLLPAIVTAGLCMYAGISLAGNPTVSTQAAPTAATATHALNSSTAATAAATVTQPAPAKASEAAPSASTADTPPPATAPTPSSSSMPATLVAPSIPTRGMSMANVEHIFGSPQEKLPEVPDPGTKLHPPITRWVYPGYVVYFEYNYVVHTVLKAHPFADSSDNGS